MIPPVSYVWVFLFMLWWHHRICDPECKMLIQCHFITSSLGAVLMYESFFRLLIESASWPKRTAMISCLMCSSSFPPAMLPLCTPYYPPCSSSSFLDFHRFPLCASAWFDMVNDYFFLSFFGMLMCPCVLSNKACCILGGLCVYEWIYMAVCKWGCIESHSSAER